MKKIILLLLLIPFLGYGQKIRENKVDKFTGQHLIETSEESLIKGNKWKNQWNKIHMSLRYVDGDWVLPTFIELEEIEKYDQNSRLIFLLGNGETIILPSLYTGIGSEDVPGVLGGVKSGVYGFSTVFPLTNEDVNKLQINIITDVRLSVMGHNYDFEVGKKEQDLIQKMIQLINHNINKK